MLLDKDKDILGSLNVGEAVVKLQGRIPRPFQIAIPQFIIEKGKITDTLVIEHMQHIAPAFPQEDFRLPPSAEVATSQKSVPQSQTRRMGNAEVGFLKDIHDHPESGIAARYKRLNLSVRQGQKVKATLTEKGLIEEHQESTNRGRLTIVRLTEKAEAILDQNSV